MAQTKSVERGARVRFPPPLVFLGGILLGVACEYLVAPAPVPVGRAISAIGGLVLLIAGVGFIASARVHFTRTGQSPIPWTPSSSLILQGLYRYTRNPMYVGMTLVQLGVGLGREQSVDFVVRGSRPRDRALHRSATGGAVSVRAVRRELQGLSDPGSAISVSDGPRPIAGPPLFLAESRQSPPAAPPQRGEPLPDRACRRRRWALRVRRTFPPPRRLIHPWILSSQDICQAVRGLSHSPGFAALTVLCLALGIGVNSAVFSIADNVSLRPLPFEEPERLVALYSTQPSSGRDRSGLVSGLSRLEGAGAQLRRPRRLFLSEPVDHRRRRVRAVPGVGRHLESLCAARRASGPRPAIRIRRPPGRPPVVMLSHGLWQRRYAADASIVGRIWSSTARRTQ